MPQRIRLQDVASRAGVSVSAASMALHDPPREVSAATVARVRAAAEELGYVPDPAARALAAQSTTSRHPFRGTVAFLVNGSPDQTEFMRDEQMTDKPERMTLRRLLEDFGYTLDIFCLPQSAAGARRLATILHSRGTVGLLVDFMNWHYPWPFPWENYPVVARSLHPLGKPFSSVICHSSNDILLAVKKCRALGYSRIGFVHACWFPDWHMGFTYASESFGGTLRKHQLSMDDWDEKRFLSWFEKHRPDAILANEGHKVVDCLRKRGVRVPEDVGYCCLDVPDESREISGIRQSREELDSQSVALLHQHITRRLKSQSAGYVHIEIAGSWNEGVTLRPAPETLQE